MSQNRKTLTTETTEQDERVKVCDEARSWIGTPYHHAARVKGRDGGVDCGMFLLEVYRRCGLIPYLDPGPYPPDWALHRSDEKYLAMVERYAHRVETPQPGDVVLYLVGRCFSHGGIVLAWPIIVAASFQDRGVSLADGQNGWLRGREHRFYSLW